MRFELFSEYSAFNNSDEQDARSVWMEGENIFLGASLEFPTALKIHVNYLINTMKLQNEFSRDRFTFGFSFILSNIEWNLTGRLWKNHLPDDLNWADYYKYVEKTDGNGRWFQQYSEVPFEKYTVLGYETGFLWESKLSYEFEMKNHKAATIIKNKFAHHDLFLEPKFMENIIIFKFYVSDKWKIKIDTRIPFYNDPFLQLKTDFSNDEDVFISNYSEISFHLSKDVWLSLGYGVNPLIIDSVTDEFYDKGREEYLNNVGGLPEYVESYYGGFGEKIRKAETMLMNENRLSIQAVIKF